jgi:hypothetical protein
VCSGADLADISLGGEREDAEVFDLLARKVSKL